MNDEDLKLTDAELKKLKKRIRRAIAYQSGDDLHFRAAEIFQSVLHAQDTRLLTHRPGDDGYLQQALRRRAEIQERILYPLMQKNRDEVNLAMSLTSKAIEVEARMAACRGRERGKETRDKNTKLFRRAVCDEYKRWKQKNPTLSPEAFHRALDRRLPERLRLFSKRLRRKGRIITSRQLRNILAPALRAK